MEPEFDTGLAPEDVDPARPRPIDTPWGSFALYEIGGELLAAQSFCPHLEGPLFQGTIAGDTITCPWHQWRFSLRTGARIDLGGCLRRAGDDLVTCDVRIGSRGTIVLALRRR